MSDRKLTIQISPEDIINGKLSKTIKYIERLSSWTDDAYDRDLKIYPADLKNHVDSLKAILKSDIEELSKSIDI
jgi:hypothetical protein